MSFSFYSQCSRILIWAAVMEDAGRLRWILNIRWSLCGSWISALWFPSRGADGKMLHWLCASSASNCDSGCGICSHWFLLVWQACCWCPTTKTESEPDGDPNASGRWRIDLITESLWATGHIHFYIDQQHVHITSSTVTCSQSMSGMLSVRTCTGTTGHNISVRINRRGWPADRSHRCFSTSGG